MRRGTEAHESAPLSTSGFHILLALADGDRHGYAIAKEVEDATRGAVSLGPATLYRTIKQLLADGWIAEVDGDDERRRVYRLTPRGRKVAVAEAQRLEAVVRMARERRLLPALG
ncbi:MAG TPA: PadR family transcriptional regulator [Candidatus Elarobacter sp.]|jgi:DNA-binding PadR family transcriptional regulator|nr:PadR family transcriptional regulator [Candidatus Elarobacter sp.]